MHPLSGSLSTVFGFDWNLDYKGRKEGKHVGLLEKHPRRQGESQQQTHVTSSVGMEPSPR